MDNTSAFVRLFDLNFGANSKYNPLSTNSWDFRFGADSKYNPLSKNSWEQEPEHYIRRSLYVFSRLLCLSVRKRKKSKEKKRDAHKVIEEGLEPPKKQKKRKEKKRNAHAERARRNTEAEAKAKVET